MIARTIGLCSLLIGGLAFAQNTAPPQEEPRLAHKLLEPKKLSVNERAFEGVLSIEFACSHGEGEHDHGSCHRSVKLTTSAGKVLDLDIPSEIQAGLSKDKDLMGEYVRVESEKPASGGRFEVKKISRVPEKFWPKNFKREFKATTSRIIPNAPQLGSKPYLVVLAKYSGQTAEPHLRSYYDTLFGSTAPGLAHWFTSMSYGRMNIQGTTIVGWITLPKTQAQYVGGANNLVDMNAVINDACDILDSQADFRQYYGINIMINGGIGNAGGIGGGVVMTRDGENRFWGGTVNSPSHTQSLLAHEMGHSLGLGHAGNQFGDQYGSPNDVMGSGYVSTPGLLYRGIGYHAYQRWSLNWLPVEKEEVVWPGTTRVIKLERRSNPVDTTAKQAIRVLMPGSASRYFVIESVKGGDYEPTSTGVTLTEVDEGRTGNWQGSDPVRMIDANGNNNLADSGSMLQPGKTWSSPSNGLTVTVIGSGPTSYTVQVTVAASVGLASTVKSNGNAGPYTLREAISFANQFPNRTIGFNFAANQLSLGIVRIRPLSWLPDITGAGTVFNGATQTTFGGNTNVNGPEIVVDGTQAGTYVSGLVAKGSGIEFRNLVIQNFQGNGILFREPGVTSGRAANCYIGTDQNGALKQKNGFDGVSVTQGASGITIEDNLISGNENRGIGVWDLGSNNVVIQNNIIGLNRTGYGSLSGGQGVGISIIDGPKNITIKGNTVSNHTYAGVEVFGKGPENVTIAGNRIGTLINGAVKAGNKSHAILVAARDTDTTAPKNIQIGGTASADRNFLGGSAYAQIWIGHPTTSGVSIRNNWIGIGSNVTGNIGGASDGIVVRDTPAVVIGGPGLGEGNFIGNNGASGIWAKGNDLRILGNTIGFNPNGGAASHLYAGVSLNECLRAKVGGTASGEGNVIANCGNQGVALWNSDNGFVQGNTIGMSKSGTPGPIGYEGVVLASGSTGNLVGGSTPQARNILGSSRRAVCFFDATTTANLIQGNWMGFAPDGATARPLTEHGVMIGNGSSGNTIGGATATLGNLIGNTTFSGIVLFNTTGNTLRNNVIGVNALGASALVEDGIGLSEAANNNSVIGNTVSFASRQGIGLYKAVGNTIQSNVIGFKPNGTAGSIAERAILLSELSNNSLIGGSAAGQGNRIGNAKAGIILFNVSGTEIHGNQIGLSASGGAAPITEDGVGIFDRSSRTKVGSAGAGANVITNCATGVGSWGDTTTGATIRFNQIYGNSGLGINLYRNDSTGGVSLNDIGDADTGPNELQNFPLIASVGASSIIGSFNSRPNATFTLDFYSSPTADPTGYGEGRTYLGSVNVTTNSAGNVNFTAGFAVAAGQWVTATATNAALSTSEFSLATQRP